MSNKFPGQKHVLFRSVRHFPSIFFSVSPDLRKGAFKKHAFPKLFFIKPFLDIFKIQKCPNPFFFHQSLVASFFEGV